MKSERRSETAGDPRLREDDARLSPMARRLWAVVCHRQDAWGPGSMTGRLRCHLDTCREAHRDLARAGLLVPEGVATTRRYRVAPEAAPRRAPIHRRPVRGTDPAAVQVGNAELIARFLDQHGATRCPTRYAAGSVPMTLDRLI